MSELRTRVESNKSLNNFKKYIADVLDDIEADLVYKRPGSGEQVYMKPWDEGEHHKVVTVERGTGDYIVTADRDLLSMESINRLKEMGSVEDPNPTAEDLMDETAQQQSQRRGRESVPRPEGPSGRLGSVYKRFSQEEAGYKGPSHAEFDRTHKQCKDCVHYDDHGNCTLVPNIDPNGYCEEFFADVGVFGHNHGGVVEENLVLWGELFDWDMEQAKEFGIDVREIIQRNLR